MSEGEKYLLEKAKQGDVKAFEELIEGYQKKVYNIALKILGNPDDAGELAQEVFIRVFKSIGKFREEARFSTWLYRITTNACLDSLRKQKNKRQVSLDEDVRREDGEMRREVEDSRPTPDIEAERNEIKKIVHAAINALPEEHRTVIVLRDIQGFSYEDIARIINCPEGTVKSRINRARLNLKEMLVSRRELLIGGYVKLNGKEGLI